MPAICLVVEDEAEIAELMKIYLEEMGHQVVLASSGEAALEYWQSPGRPPVDLLFTDWKMGLVSGPQLIRHIQDGFTHQTMPKFVLMTGELFNQDEQAKLIKELGQPLAFLPKPFNRDDVQKLVVQLLL